MTKLQNRGISVYRTDKQGTIIAVSYGDHIEWNQEACNDYSSGESDSSTTEESNEIVDSAGQESISESSDSTVSSEVTYIGNANTRKFHYPSCNSVDQMNESNKVFFYGSRDEIISQGYDPCGNCNP